MKPKEEDVLSCGDSSVDAVGVTSPAGMNSDLSESSFPSRDAAEDTDPGQSMQTETASALARAVQAGNDLPFDVNHLALPIYFETGERVVEDGRGPCRIEGRL